MFLSILSVITNPKVIMAAVFALLLSAMGFYVWYSQHQIERLSGQVAQQQTELALQRDTIATQQRRLQALQELNDRFNNDVNTIRRNSAVNQQRLRDMNLRDRSLTQPRQVESEINTRTQSLFNELNQLGQPRGAK